MKFAKQLLSLRNHLCLEGLKDSVLPYKYWKKYIKYHKNDMNPDEIVNTLEKQCKDAEENFVKELSHTLKKKPLIGCCKIDNKIQQDISHELILFSDINRTALYKICKKLQKNGAPNLMNYYSKASFKFIQSHELMYLKMKIESQHECPICMEEANSYIIMDCSHYMCLTCMLKMTNTEKLNATPYNKVSIGIHKFESCPFCRRKHPLKQLDKYHFYPSIPKS
jgi:hypothetical protein